jgi:hypothetical protein
MAEKFHVDWEVVPYDLNKKPKEDPDAYALVPANTERQLEAMPPRQRSSAQSYFARPVLTAPTQPLLLEGSPSSSKGKEIIKVPAGTKILPPKPNERIIGVKTNRSGEISSVRYTTEERPYFEGVRAAKVRFVPPKEAPKHALNAFETPPKRRRTIADVDEELRVIKNSIIEIQNSNISMDRRTFNHNTTILKLRDDLADANKRIDELEHSLRRRERR